MLLRQAVRRPAMCSWQRLPVSHRVCAHRLAVRTLASYGQQTTDVGGKRAGILQRSLTAFFAISGVLLWGTTLLEYVMLDSTLLPEELEELVKAEEKEEEKVSRFYGLEGMSKDISVADDDYFAALDERKLLLTNLIKKLDAHPQMDKLLGTHREVTYLANRDSCPPRDATAAESQDSIQVEVGHEVVWCPRFHIQGQRNDQMAVAQAKFVNNGRRTGELVPISLQLEMVRASETVLDVSGPVPHGLKWMQFDL